MENINCLISVGLKIDLKQEDMYLTNIPGKIFFKYPAKCDHAIPTAKLPAGRSWFSRTSPV